MAAAALDPAGAPRDGVTVSGGEPFAQPDGTRGAPPGPQTPRTSTPWSYSGSTLEALRRRPEPAVAEALRLTDVLVDGPFVRGPRRGRGGVARAPEPAPHRPAGGRAAPVRPRICPPAPRPIPKEVTRMADTEPAADAIGPSHPLPQPPHGGARPLVRVLFSTTGEFVRELRARGPNVEPVVRATLTWAPDPAGAPAYDVSVVATYLRRVGPDVVALTELRHYAGVAWIVSGGRDRQPAEAAARRLLAIVEEAGAWRRPRRRPGHLPEAPPGSGLEPPHPAGADATLERPSPPAPPPITPPPGGRPEGGPWS